MIRRDLDRDQVDAIIAARERLLAENERLLDERDRSRREADELRHEAEDPPYVVELTDGRRIEHESATAAVSEARTIAYREGIETRVRRGDSIEWSTRANGGCIRPDGTRLGPTLRVRF